MAEFDWNNLENEFKGEYKQYAEDGTYDVVLDSVTEKTTNSGTIIFEFNFQEDDTYKYPKASRVFFKDEKKNFRCFHYRNIMMVLGAPKEKAQKAVETCEGKANREAIADAYAQMFDKLAQKHPTVKLEVSREENGGKTYARGEFADQSIHFSDKKKPAVKQAEVLPTEDDVDDLDVPF